MPRRTAREGRTHVLLLPQLAPGLGGGRDSMPKTARDAGHLRELQQGQNRPGRGPVTFDRVTITIAGQCLSVCVCVCVV